MAVTGGIGDAFLSSQKVTLARCSKELLSPCTTLNCMKGRKTGTKDNPIDWAHEQHPSAHGPRKHVQALWFLHVGYPQLRKHKPAPYSQQKSVEPNPLHRGCHHLGDNIQELRINFSL